MSARRLLLPCLLAASLSCAPAPRSGSFRVVAGGAQLAMNVEGSGSPAVVLESGLGDDSKPWAAVAAGLAKITRVVTYDRAGMGSSEPARRPRTATAIAEDLHEALAAAGLRPPYVLAAHSAGGAYVRVFASRYPREVNGLVLVDPTPDGFFDRVKDVLSPEEAAAFDRRREEHAASSPGRRAEWDSLDEALSEAAIVRLPEIPITLISGTKEVPEGPEALLRLKLSLHEEWVRRIPEARHVVVPDAGHYVQIDRPDLVVAEIRRLVEIASR